MNEFQRFKLALMRIAEQFEEVQNFVDDCLKQLDSGRFSPGEVVCAEDDLKDLFGCLTFEKVFEASLNEGHDPEVCLVAAHRMNEISKQIQRDPSAFCGRVSH